MLAHGKSTTKTVYVCLLDVTAGQTVIGISPDVFSIRHYLE